MQLDFSVLWSEWGVAILYGFRTTLVLSAVVLAAALAIGTLCGVARWRGPRWLARCVGAYVGFVRTTPALVQILFWYFSASYILPTGAMRTLRDFGFELIAAAVALAIYHGAYITEVVRAALEAVPKGQVEAAASLGLRFRIILRKVVFPQAFRIAMPALTNEAVGLIKNTSLALAIGVAELTYQAKMMEAYTFRPIEGLLAATVLYLVTCWTVAGAGALLSRRLSRHAAPVGGGGGR